MTSLGEVVVNKKKRYLLIVILSIVLIPLIIYFLKLLHDPSISHLFDILAKLFLVSLGIVLISKKLWEFIRYEDKQNEIKMREENRKKYEGEKYKQQDIIELLKYHLVSEHGYDLEKLEADPASYLYEIQAEDKD